MKRKSRKTGLKGLMQPKKKMRVNQDQHPNFREDGKLFLVRCFACGDSFGRENWAMAVSRGTCAFCGWRERGKKFDRANSK